ncbi:MAG: hypothetical protein M1839_003315 [Geoglossum umbratile]|nr:MAG: hypothetical protein M1839_003315 [Geoglossum umbratile]
MSTSWASRKAEPGSCVPVLPTPPSSAGEPLRSVPPNRLGPVQQAVQIIKSIKEGRSPAGWWSELHVDGADFLLLKKLVDDKKENIWDYVQDKIRFDYDTKTSSLIFRMPSLTHDTFNTSIYQEIISHIERIKRDTSRPDAAAIAKKIRYSSSGNIGLNSGFGIISSSTRSPDASFRYIGSKYPQVVIETSFSQKKRDLARLADDYITDSGGNIKLVIGFDIEYCQSKKGATVSVWRPMLNFGDDGTPYLISEKFVDGKVFRNDDSTPIRIGDTLCLPFSAFVSPKDALLVPSDMAITISYETLYSFLEDAEDCEEDSRCGEVAELPPGTRIRKRPRTPEEQLRDEDELQFAKSEADAERGAYEKDSTWGNKKTKR